jgi:hypothetical protein
MVPGRELQRMNLVDPFFEDHERFDLIRNRHFNGALHIR